jgi:hypothetical protein
MWSSSEMLRSLKDDFLKTLNNSVFQFADMGNRCGV